MNRFQPLCFSLLALAAVPLAVGAAGGSLEINQDCAAVGCFANDGAGLPVTINAPGSYVLTSDIVVSTANGTGIQINASPVDIDLNHHTISGGGSCTGSPVSSCSAGNGGVGVSQYNTSLPGTVRIHDGTIRGFTHDAFSAAMYLNDTGDGTVLERLNVLENSGNAAIAISAQSGTVGGTIRLRDSQVARNGGAGIGKVGGPTSLTISIENSDLSGNKTYGVSSFISATYVGNRFNSNGNFGVNCTSTCALGSNSFSGNNSALVQYSVGTLRDMGGNVCLDHACP
jgi:hypothetical protein